MDFTLSERALHQLLRVAQAEAIDVGAQYLRVAVLPGGCSGLTYALGWDTTVREEDEVFEASGIRLVMDLKSQLYVEGSELDFTDGLEGKGFHFHNPQASRTCACGESFGL